MAAKKKTNKQHELALVMVLSLILGGGGGYILRAVTTPDDELATPSIVAENSSSHSHGGSMYTVDADVAPSVEVIVTEDAKSGYNVRLTTENFTFTPEKVNNDNVIGEGHAHLYVDGEKVARLYGPDFHYDGSFEGTKTFRVTLNANDHSEYAVDGDVIEAETKVTHDSNSEYHSHSDNDDPTH